MSLDSVPLRRVSITSRITRYIALTILTCIAVFAGLMYAQLTWSIQQQADALGQSLLQQTSTTVENTLSADDALSLAVLLRELASNSYVRHAAIYSADNRILAEAGKSSRKENGVYSKPLSFQGVTAGSLHLQIDMQKLRKPLLNSLQSIAVLGVALLIFVALLSAYLGRWVAVPLQHLSNWLINPAPPAPHINRPDEIGLLARQLNEHFNAATQQKDAPTFHSERPSHAPATPAAQPTVSASSAYCAEPSATQLLNARTTMLAVEFGSFEQLRLLPNDRLVNLQKKYRHALEQSALLYSGKLHMLGDGRSLISFHSDSAEYPCNALCCGELLRAFGHALQTEVASSGIALHIQLGLSEGPLLKNVPLGDLLLSESTQAALELSQYSSNLLLLSNTLAEHSKISACARTHAVAKPHNASGVEFLLPPYPALLQSQLNELYKYHPS